MTILSQYIHAKQKVILIKNVSIFTDLFSSYL